MLENYFHMYIHVTIWWINYLNSSNLQYNLSVIISYWSSLKNSFFLHLFALILSPIPYSLTLSLLSHPLLSLSSPIHYYLSWSLYSPIHPSHSTSFLIHPSFLLTIPLTKHSVNVNKICTSSLLRHIFPNLDIIKFLS